MSLQLDPRTDWVIKKKGYTLEQRLNAGAFGTVYKGKNREKEDVAIKIMFLDKLKEYFKKKFMPRELQTLQTVEHPYIIDIFDIILCGGKMFIFMEFANGGDITGVIRKQRGPLDEKRQAQVWFSQSTGAMHYLHNTLGIAHRDLKPDNVLLHNNVCKLSDFGFARESWDFGTRAPIMSQTWCGTRPYQSVQIHRQVPYNPLAADVWAMGVMLHVMLQNKYPFHPTDQERFQRELDSLESHLRSRCKVAVSAQVNDLILRCLTVDESSRITLHQMKDHSWILKQYIK